MWAAAVHAFVALERVAIITLEIDDHAQVI
jgi:hypothetical protein